MHNWRKWCSKWTHTYFLSGWFQVVRKWWRSCTTQCKMLLFCARTKTYNLELAHLKKVEEGNRFWHLATFWFGTFVMLFHTASSLVGHENTWRWMVCCHKGLQVYHFEILRDFHILRVCTIPTYILYRLCGCLATEDTQGNTVCGVKIKIQVELQNSACSI